MTYGRLVALGLHLFLLLLLSLQFCQFGFYLFCHVVDIYCDGRLPQIVLLLHFDREEQIVKLQRVVVFLFRT